jgi:transketolase
VSRTTADRDSLKVDDFMGRVSWIHTLPKPWGSALVRAANADSRIVCLCADVTPPTETDFFRDRLPDRFFNMGIAEANMIGVAAGMARTGDVAFAHSFCAFATKRCYDQISMQLAYPRLNVKVVGFTPGISTFLGVTHHAIEDVAMIRATPNMIILEPSGPEQFDAVLEAALEFEGPAYLRMTRTYGALPEGLQQQPLEVGKGYVLREGADAAIIAAGLMVAIAQEAATLLAAEGIEATVVNMSSIKPLDEQLVCEVAARTGVVVTAENHNIIGGLGSAVAETLMEQGVSCAFRRVGLRDEFAEGATPAYLFEKYGMSATAVAASVREAVAARRG